MLESEGVGSKWGISGIFTGISGGGIGRRVQVLGLGGVRVRFRDERVRLRDED